MASKLTKLMATENRLVVARGRGGVWVAVDGRVTWVKVVQGHQLTGSKLNKGCHAHTVW